MEKAECEVNVCIVGSSGVGKSSLLKQAKYVFRGKNSVDQPPNITDIGNTLGLDLGFLITPMDGGKSLKIRVYDPPGSLNLFAVVKNLLNQKNHVVILVFDLESRRSYQDVETTWREEARAAVGGENGTIVLVGNKADSNNRQVTKEEGEALRCDINAIHYFEVSAATGYNVKELFTEISNISSRKITKLLLPSFYEETKKPDNPAPAPPPRQRKRDAVKRWFKKIFAKG